MWLCREYDAGALLARPTAPRPPVGRAALRDMATEGQRVTLVWKREGRRERPWVMVAQSAVLRGGAAIGGDAGRGLYAWRDFEHDELIGRYTGTSMGLFEADDDDSKEAAIAALAEARRDKVLELERDDGRVELLDATDAGAPYVELANDARNLRGPTGAKRRHSAQVDGHGCLRSLRRGRRHGQGERWGKVKANGGWEELAAREILWPYGDAYWKATGQAAGPSRHSGSGEWSGGVGTKAAVRSAARRERAARRAREGGEGGRVDYGEVKGLLLGEVGQEQKLGGDAEGRVKCLFVTEVVVAARARRERVASRMLVRAIRETQAEEVHMIVREQAEQQKGMREWCTRMGMQRVADAAAAGLAYLPRVGGERAETYWHGRTADMLEALGGNERARRAIDMKWTTGVAAAVLPAAERKDMRRMMRDVHEGRGGSHEGRTWDEREVVPRRHGCSVVARNAGAVADGAAAEQRGGEAGRGEGEGEEQAEAEWWEAEMAEAHAWPAEGDEGDEGVGSDEERYEDEMFDGGTGRAADGADDGGDGVQGADGGRWQAGWGVEEDGGVGSDEERYEDEMFGAGAGHEAGAGTGEATAGGAGGASPPATRVARTTGSKRTRRWRRKKWKWCRRWPQRAGQAAERPWRRTTSGRSSGGGRRSGRWAGSCTLHGAYKE